MVTIAAAGAIVARTTCLHDASTVVGKAGHREGVVVVMARPDEVETTERSACRSNLLGPRMLAFHGCSHEVADSVCKTGFAIVPYRDEECCTDQDQWIEQGGRPALVTSKALLEVGAA